MPLYEYRCPTCDAAFELLRPMRSSSEPAMCPGGHAGAERVVSLVASRAREGGAGGPAFEMPAGAGCACAAGGSCACAN